MGHRLVSPLWRASSRAMALLMVAVLALMPLTALAEITSTVTGDTLTVTSDADDDISFACVNGNVQINGAAPGSGDAACAAIVNVVVQGGPGPNVIDASGLLTDTFTSLAQATLNGGAGADVITGTILADTLIGGPGSDRLVAGRGRDTMRGESGDDTLVWNNGDGSDVMEGGEGYDTIEVNGAPGRNDAFSVTAVGSRVAFSRTNFGNFTLDIGDAERLYFGRTDISDTVTVNPLPGMVVDIAPTDAHAHHAPARQEPMVIVASGEITNAVQAYQLLLGGVNNGGEPGPFTSGFRTINWDGVPEEQSRPNPYSPDFFNAPTAPRARGAVFSTPGEGLFVSAAISNSTNTLPRFGDVNPTYADQFKTFSPEKLFSPLGSQIADIIFFVPGTNEPAVTHGFGAVYTDIDTEHTAFEYFDIDGNSLGKYAAPIANEGLSFLGVIFPYPVIHRVRVSYGTSPLGPDEGPGIDVAVMDDFIYGEPVAPSSLAPEATAAEDEEFAAKFQTVNDARLSSLHINFALQPPAGEGQTYAVWLVNDAGELTLAGTTAGGEPFTYVDAGGANLVGTTAAVQISREDAAAAAAGNVLTPGALAWAGEIPSAIRADVRQLVVAAPDTPANMPYDPGMKAQAELALTHAQLAREALLVGDLAGGRAHGEHVWNILHGEADYLFGDVDEDGQTQNPGDGYGVIVYARQTANTADRIAETAGLDAHRRSAAVGVAVCARNVAGTFTNATKDGVLALLAALNAEAATIVVDDLIASLEVLINGTDVDGNGTVDARQGECGAEQAYQLSHHLFDIHLEPAQ